MKDKSFQTEKASKSQLSEWDFAHTKNIINTWN